MTQYELPDGFQGMETCPADTMVNLIFANGYFNHDFSPSRRGVYGEPIGWAPIVPPKKKRRFVAKEAIHPSCAPYVVWDSCVAETLSTNIPTRESAQAVADIYEQAYEGGV